MDTTRTDTSRRAGMRKRGMSENNVLRLGPGTHGCLASIAVKATNRRRRVLRSRLSDHLESPAPGALFACRMAARRDHGQQVAQETSIGWLSNTLFGSQSLFKTIMKDRVLFSRRSDHLIFQLRTGGLLRLQDGSQDCGQQAAQDTSIGWLLKCLMLIPVHFSKRSRKTGCFVLGCLII